MDFRKRKKNETDSKKAFWLSTFYALFSLAVLIWGALDFEKVGIFGVITGSVGVCVMISMMMFCHRMKEK